MYRWQYFMVHCIRFARDAWLDALDRAWLLNVASLKRVSVTESAVEALHQRKVCFVFA
jgi:hypothetical protein